jgi:protoporphyrinogen oxidase
MTRGHVAVIGAGFTGLSAALRLLAKGFAVSVFEGDASPGGLAGGFDVGGVELERFYHHWFSNDRYVIDLVTELGRSDEIVLRPTRTGLYFTKSIFKLSSPLDLLRFTPLALPDRIRLGLLVFRARAIKDWRPLEALTAKEWLIKVCGQRVYQTVWEPLLVGKFGPYADTVSAVWFWKKIALRGGSRASDGREVLAYYRGGFAALARAMADEVEKRGGRILYNARVDSLVGDQSKISAVRVKGDDHAVDYVLATPSLPQIADLMAGQVPQAYQDRLRRVKYLANVCLVLVLDRSLSSTYWLNVGDTDFPFVGIIEHTNFEPPESYGGRHIVYLSKYLPVEDQLYHMDPDALLDFSVPYLKRMFPAFERNWVVAHHVWRADYAQPIMERHYSQIMPSVETPISNVFIATMAQVYPEDRGTNYAIRAGWDAADRIAGLSAG